MLGWLFGRKKGDPSVTESRELFSLARTVDATPAAAFTIFVDKLNDWWPRDYTWAKGNLAAIVIEAKYGGRCFERDTAGAIAVWGKVLAYERPGHIVIAWQIKPDRSPEPEEAASSRVDIRFIANPAGKTEVLVVHRDFPRHGDGWEKYKTQMAGKDGWPMLIDAYTAFLAKGG
jgi:uncharacterized protein YndB with AHSA1/START domain